MSKREISVGEAFGLWTVTKAIPSHEKPGPGNWFECRCQCGRTQRISATSIRCKRTLGCRSCHNGRKTHGKSQTKEHRTWKQLLKRGRVTHGIYADVNVCNRWLPDNDGFRAFLEDMGPAPSPNHSIDRIDGTRGYSPDNCRWATPKEQALNTSRNRILCIGGERQPVSVFAERYGVNPNKVYTRLSREWNPEEALEIKSHQTNRRNQRGDKHYGAQLTAQQVQAIRKMVAAGGMTRKEAAKRYRVSYWTICNILQRKSWAWLED